jgi:hypothetical protein
MKVMIQLLMLLISCLTFAQKDTVFYEIGATKPHQTIHSAFSALIRDMGNTPFIKPVVIRISEGTYREVIPITIVRPTAENRLIITAADNQKVVLEGYETLSKCINTSAISHVTVRGIVISNFRSNVVCLRYNSNNWLFEYCVIKQTHRERNIDDGIYTVLIDHGSSNNTFRHCIIEDYGWAIVRLCETAGIGNLIDHCTFATSNGGFDHRGLLLHKDNNSVKNCIFYLMPSLYPSFIWDENIRHHNGDFTNLPNRYIDYNLYKTGSNKTETHGGQNDIHSIYNQDPQFVAFGSPGSRDLRLKSTSPAIGRAEGGADIGAFALGAASPNPWISYCRSTTYLDRPGRMDSKMQDYKIRIYNVQGRMVNVLPVRSRILRSGIIQNAGNLPAGIYLAAFFDGKEKKVKKLFIVK